MKDFKILIEGFFFCMNITHKWPASFFKKTFCWGKKSGRVDKCRTAAKIDLKNCHTISCTEKC